VNITLPELEQYLAKAADILRGSIDQADFKAYIFPLMFFKRISDVYLEEFSEAIEESGGDHEYAAFAENHRFAIPAGNLWEDVRNHREHRQRSADRVPGDREGQPGDSVRHLRQRQLDQQGQAARPQARRPDRALRDQDAVQRRCRA
jgi:type I restriction-modification system DNA methylase subunit